MIVMFSARRLKPGAWDQFRRAWDPGGAKPPGFQRAYHARNIRDEDEVISCGLFDMTVEDYRRWRADVDAAETQRVDRLSAFVENEHVSGVYGVVDVVEQ
jgi:heme-degrading monooxygenase HmoA